MELTSEEWVVVAVLLGGAVIAALVIWGNYGIGKLRDAIDKWEPPVR